MENSSKIRRIAIGIDIGGTKCAVTLFQINGQAEMAAIGINDIQLLDKIKAATADFAGPDAAIQAFIRFIGQLMAKHSVQPAEVLGIGISCGGPLNSRTGRILSPPNLPGWDNVDIVKRLADVYSVPVKLQNDANACALVEWKYGAGQGLSNLVFLTFGTGMGAGLILDGRLYSGTSDLAGEVGHMRLAPDGPFGYGKYGSFEGFCSGGGIADLGKRKVLERLQRGEQVSFCASEEQLDDLTAETIGLAADSGDPLAISIYRESGLYLGAGLSILVDLLNPEAIIIGSIFGRKYDLLWPAAREVLEKEALGAALSGCKVLPAQLGEQTGDYAALAVAMYA